MRQPMIALATSAFLLCGAVAAVAQSAKDPAMHRTAQNQVQNADDDDDDAATTGQGMTGGAGHGMMHGMGQGRMGGRGAGPGRAGPLTMRILFALMDPNDDGTVDLKEWQTAHERIFKAMDANKDGKLTLEEMRAFMRGRPAAPAQ